MSGNSWIVQRWVVRVPYFEDRATFTHQFPRGFVAASRGEQP